MHRNVPCFTLLLQDSAAGVELLRRLTGTKTVYLVCTHLGRAGRLPKKLCNENDDHDGAG